MAEGTSKWVSIGSEDTVIFSSHPIPGNEEAVGTVRNGLARRGARVLHSIHNDVHTSGHGKQQELRVLHSVAAPEWFVPVHGEYEHLVAHAGLARQMGLADDRVVLCVDGDRIALTDGGLRQAGSVGGAHLYVQGTVGDLGPVVLADRRKLVSSGFVAVFVVVDVDLGRIVGGPDVVSRGWVEQPALRQHEAAVADAVAAELAARAAGPSLRVRCSGGTRAENGSAHLTGPHSPKAGGGAGSALGLKSDFSSRYNVCRGPLASGPSLVGSGRWRRRMASLPNDRRHRRSRPRRAGAELRVRLEQ